MCLCVLSYKNKNEICEGLFFFVAVGIRNTRIHRPKVCYNAQYAKNKDLGKNQNKNKHIKDFNLKLVEFTSQSMCGRAL